jgi:hypothetical protein
VSTAMILASPSSGALKQWNAAYAEHGRSRGCRVARQDSVPSRLGHLRTMKLIAVLRATRVLDPRESWDGHATRAGGRVR